MVLAVSEPVNAIDSTVNGRTYSFASFTPTGDSLLVLITEVTGTGIDLLDPSDDETFTWIERVMVGGASTRFAIWTSQMAVSPGANVVDINTHADDEGTGCMGQLFEVTGHDTTTPHVQSQGNDTGLSSTDPNWTPASALNTNNCYLGCVFNSDATPNIDPPTSWTELTDEGHFTPSTGMEAAYRVNGETGTTITWGASSTLWRVLGIEIAVASAAIPIISLITAPYTPT